MKKSLKNIALVLAASMLIQNVSYAGSAIAAVQTEESKERPSNSTDDTEESQGNVQGGVSSVESADGSPDTTVTGDEEKNNETPAGGSSEMQDGSPSEAGTDGQTGTDIEGGASGEPGDDPTGSVEEPEDGVTDPDENTTDPTDTGNAQENQAAAGGSTPAENGSAATGEGNAPAENGSAATDKGNAPAENSSAATGEGNAPAENGSAATGEGNAPAENSSAATGEGNAPAENSSVTTDKGNAPAENSSAATDKGNAAQNEDPDETKKPEAVQDDLKKNPDEKEFTYDLSGGATLTIKESKKGALANVDGIVVTELGSDDELEDSLDNALGDGKEVADYVTFDIVLYEDTNENGEYDEGEDYEVEPDGEVTVSVSGISTDEDYDSVEVHHVKDKREPENKNRKVRKAKKSIAENVSDGAGAALKKARTFANDVGTSVTNFLGITDEEDQKEYMYETDKVETYNEKKTEEIKETGEISFSTDHFSKYVITFIKNNITAKEVNVVFRSFTGFNEYGNPVDPKDFDPDPSIDINTSLRFPEDGGKANLIYLISGMRKDGDDIKSGLEELYAGGKTYSFQFASFDIAGENKLDNDRFPGYNTTYDDLIDAMKAAETDSIYIWYQETTNQKIKVDVYTKKSGDPDTAYQIVNLPDKDGYITPGDLTGAEGAEKAFAAIKNYYNDDVKATTPLAFVKAVLYHEDENNLGKSHDHMIESIRVINNNYYLKLENTDSDNMYSEDSDIRLYFEAGKVLTFNINNTGNDSENSVTINGKKIDNDEQIVFSDNMVVDFKVDLNVGYKVTVKPNNAGLAYDGNHYDNENNDVVYNSSDEDNQIRVKNFSTGYDHLRDNASITIDFEKIDDPIFDVSFYDEISSKYGDGNFHGAALYWSQDGINYNEIQASDGDKLLESKDNTIYLKIVAPKTDQDNNKAAKYAMNILTINGQLIDIPGYDEEDVDSGKDTGLYDEYGQDNGEEIANVNVKLTKDTEEYCSYVITITKIKSDLKLIRCNLASVDDKSSGNITQIDDGVEVYYNGWYVPEVSDDEAKETNSVSAIIGQRESAGPRVIGNQIGFSGERKYATLGVAPDLGYYVGNITLSDDQNIDPDTVGRDDECVVKYKDNLDWNNKWYGEKIALIGKDENSASDLQAPNNNPGGKEMKVGSKKINFFFVYENGLGGLNDPAITERDELIDPSETFNFTGEMGETTTYTISEDPTAATLSNPEYKDKKFVGWALSTDEAYNENGNEVRLDSKVYKNGMQISYADLSSALESVYEKWYFGVGEAIQPNGTKGTDDHALQNYSDGVIAIYLKPVFNDINEEFKSYTVRVMWENDSNPSEIVSQDIPAIATSQAILSPMEVEAIPSVKPIVEDLLQNGYHIDPTKSSGFISLNNAAADGSVFILYYTKRADAFVNVKNASPNGTLNYKDDKELNVSDDDNISLYPTVGEKITVNIKVNGDYAVDKVEIKDGEGKKSTISYNDINGSYPNYSFDYTATAGTTNIEVFYALDKNHDGTPDEKQYIIEFDLFGPGTEGINKAGYKFTNNQDWYPEKTDIGNDTVTYYFNDLSTLLEDNIPPQVTDISCDTDRTGADPDDKTFDYWALVENGQATDNDFNRWKETESPVLGEKIVFTAVFVDDEHNHGNPVDAEWKFYVKYDENDFDTANRVSGTAPVDNNEYTHAKKVEIIQDHGLSKKNAVLVGWTVNKPVEMDIESAEVYRQLISHSYEIDGENVLFVPASGDDAWFVIHHDLTELVEGKDTCKLFAVWAADRNGNDIDGDGIQDGDDRPDYNQYIVKVTFNAGEHGNIMGGSSKTWYLESGEERYPENPESNINVTTDHMIFDRWDPEYSTGGNTVSLNDAEYQTYTALYAEDLNGDGIPDYKQENADDNNHSGGSSGGGSDRVTNLAGPGASGTTYTAGVDGNWVHVSPDNVFEPLRTPVPEGATPVTGPEWHQWKFILNNGMMLYDQWAYVKNPYAVDGQPTEGWFSFDNDGIMQYGWYLDVNTGKWYWMHRDSDGMLGTMETGWHYDDQDGKWYYLSPDGGEMVLGWQQIAGIWYYFNPIAPESTWDYNEATGGWTFNGSASRPYGSMYAGEVTPDGYRVDENGRWIN